MFYYYLATIHAFALQRQPEQQPMANHTLQRTARDSGALPPVAHPRLVLFRPAAAVSVKPRDKGADTRAITPPIFLHDPSWTQLDSDTNRVLSSMAQAEEILAQMRGTERSPFPRSLPGCDVSLARPASEAAVIVSTGHPGRRSSSLSRTTRGCQKPHQVKQVLKARTLEAQRALKNDRYTYRVTWSEEDDEYVGLCRFPVSAGWPQPQKPPCERSRGRRVCRRFGSQQRGTALNR
jgi:hypothetical protein